MVKGEVEIQTLFPEFNNVMADSPENQLQEFHQKNDKQCYIIIIINDAQNLKVSAGKTAQ